MIQNLRFFTGLLANKATSFYLVNKTHRDQEQVAQYKNTPPSMLIIWVPSQLNHRG